jgi:hypothetical protein
MTIQAFTINTAKGYAGDLVDSGPRVVQTGILTSAEAGFGVAMKRDAATVERGVALGSIGGNVFAISQREYNHEAGTRPSTGNDTKYYKTESVSLIRQGYLYVNVVDIAAVAGTVLAVNPDGTWEGTAAGSGVATTNVVAEESGLGLIKARIDIIA